jgi:hypothetical protein
VSIVVQNQPSLWQWLGPVLLFAGALITFIGAMVTLIFTLRSANKREWNKWQRETLIKLCSDAMDAAKEVPKYCLLALTREVDYHAFVADLDVASGLVSRIGSVAEQLDLLGVAYLADRCVQLQAAAEALRSATSDVRIATITGIAMQRDEVIDDANAKYAKAITALNTARVNFLTRGQREIRESA